MRVDLRLAALMAGLVAALGVAGVDAALYKWVDEKGQIQYSDKPPPVQGKGGVQMSNRGIVVRKLEPGLTPEQKKAKDDDAERKETEDHQATVQRRLDNALLQSFSSEHEIDMKRQREVLVLGAVLANLRGQERSVSERLAEDRKRAASFLGRKAALPDTVRNDLVESEAETKVIRAEIERRHQEILDTHNKYETLRSRYLELRRIEQAGLSQPAEAASSSQTAPVRK